jgi:hypothetical protein
LNCRRDERRYVVDCRDAAARIANRYQERDGWTTKEIHYNRLDHGCYLSLEGIEGGQIDSGKRAYCKSQIVTDVNENRAVLRCTANWESGEPEEKWVCDGPDGNSITRDRFLELRKRYLER